VLSALFMLLRVAVLAVLTSASAWACGPLRLAFHPYPGMYEPQAGGEAKGLDVDFIRELARRSGCKIIGAPGTGARTWPALVAGEVDLATAVAFRPQREADVEFLTMVKTRHMVLMRRSAVRAGPAAFEADPTLRLGVVKAAPYLAAVGQWVDRLRAQDRVSESADMLSLLKAFEAGRTDAVLIFPLALNSQSEDWLAERRLLDWWPDESISGGLAASRRSVHAPVRERLRQAVRAMHADGSLQQLAERYFGPALAAHYSWIDRP
jgi:ABC-type amino acid transport substrate-binding protein